MSNARSYQPVLIADLVTNPVEGQVAITTLAAAVLPDGCEAFALSNRTLYRLNKLSTDLATGGAAAGIVPAAGGGNWIPQSASQASIGVQNFTDLAVAFDGISNYHPLIGAFTSILSGGEWVLDTLTGISTWKGPSAQRFLMTVSASMYNNATVKKNVLAISIDGSTPVPSSRECQVTSPVAFGSASLYQMSLSTVLSLNQNQTVQIFMRGEVSDNVITNLVYTLTPLS